MSEKSPAASASLLLLFTLSALAMLGPFTTDTYFPFFPDMEVYFSISQTQAQLSLTVYLLTSTLMMLFHGAFSDSWGRKPVIVWTLLGFVLSSLACAWVQDYNSLLLFRAMQGLFVGAGTVVGQAMIRDRFSGVAAQKIIAQVTMLFGLAPAIAPLAGGMLHAFFPWQSSFYLLAGLGLMLLLVCVFSLDESLPASKRQPFQLVTLLANYGAIAREPRFLALAGCIAAGFGGFLIYVGGAPDFVFRVLHLSAMQFGWLFIPIVIGLMAGSALVTRLTGKVSNGRLINISFVLMGLAASFNLLNQLLINADSHWPSWPMLQVLPVLVYTFGLTFLIPGVMVLALDLFPEKRGTAASIQAFIQMLVFVLLSALVVPLVLGSGLRYAMAMLAMFLLNLLCWTIYRVYQRKSG